jgi:hypothetical protein
MKFKEKAISVSKTNASVKVGIDVQISVSQPVSARNGFVGVALLAFCSQIVWSQNVSRPPEAEVEVYLQRAALVGFEWVDQSLNRIILLRDAHAVCAVRFLSYGRDNDVRPSTSFDTGDATQTAAYEAFLMPFGEAKNSAGPVVRRELDYRGLRGIGRLAFRTGNTTVRCGQGEYSWVFPTGVRLNERQDHVSFAPTNWTAFDEIRLDHPKLRWYQRDPKRQREFVVIPQEELPP